MSVCGVGADICEYICVTYILLLLHIICFNAAAVNGTIICFIFSVDSSKYKLVTV